MNKSIRKRSSTNNSIRSRRLKQISVIASSLFFKYGYHKTTTRLIAKECGLSKGALYHYIKSKDDLLDLILNYLATRFDEFTVELRKELKNTSPTIALKTAINISLNIIEQEQDTIVFCYREAQNLKREQWIKLFNLEMYPINLYKEILIAGKLCGEFKSNDSSLIAYYTLILCTSWATRRWYFRKHYTLEEYIDKCTNNVLAMAAETREIVHPVNNRTRDLVDKR